MEDAAHSLVLAFDTDEPSFARGFEAGALWSALREDDACQEATIHTANSEMAIRMADALGRSVIGDELDATWTRVEFGPPEARAGLYPQPGSA